MKTMLILVEDDYADTLPTRFPEDKAWVLSPRYDAFRCRLHHALETYGKHPETFEAYHKVLAETDLRLRGEEA